MKEVNEMLPQVIDSKHGRFRQYLVNGVMTIGVSEGEVHSGVLVVDPHHQKRLFQFYVNGHQCPTHHDYLAAFGEVVQTPIDFSYEMSVDLDEEFRSAPRGLIIIHLFRGDGQKDSPQPLMDEGLLDTRGLTLNSANQASIAYDVPDYLELVERYHIRLVPWNQLKEVAQPTLERHVWGPPLTKEDGLVTQFWSPDRLW